MVERLAVASDTVHLWGARSRPNPPTLVIDAYRCVDHCLENLEERHLQHIDVFAVSGLASVSHCLVGINLMCHDGKMYFVAFSSRMCRLWSRIRILFGCDQAPDNF